MEILKETTPLILTENNSLILCEKVIMATHYPINDAILVATGFNKWGMSAGTVAAKLLTDTILGHENRYASLFDPTRKKLKLVDTKTFL